MPRGNRPYNKLFDVPREGDNFQPKEEKEVEKEEEEDNAKEEKE